MIIHQFIPERGLITITPEDLDDLWYLRRFIKVDDLIESETSRVVKRAGQYARPDKGERIRVHIKLRVKNLKMSNELDRLRITGVIIEASNEIVPRGSHHTLNITHGHTLSLKRDRFNAEDIRFIQALHNKDTRFIIVAIDRREAGIGIIQGTHMRIHTVIRSGHGGKHYDESVNIDEFYNKVEEVLKSIYTNG
ncbi:MAG: hypothetical protein NZ896_02850, partial [Nitrososphaerales archaeon]|nr:hypothetical protein [Nitrososphaerales archaeon]